MAQDRVRSFTEANQQQFEAAVSDSAHASRFQTHGDVSARLELVQRATQVSGFKRLGGGRSLDGREQAFVQGLKRQFVRRFLLSGAIQLDEDQEKPLG